MFRSDERLKVYLHRDTVDFRKSINGLGTTPLVTTDGPTLSSAVFSAAALFTASLIASQEDPKPYTVMHRPLPGQLFSHNSHACRFNPGRAPSSCCLLFAAFPLSATLAIRRPGQPSVWRCTPCCPSHRPPRPFARGLLRCSGCSVGGEIASP